MRLALLVLAALAWIAVPVSARAEGETVDTWDGTAIADGFAEGDGTQGKFLALLTIFAIPVAIICFYPLIMAQYGSVPMGEAYLSILAYFLFGMTAIAIGLFLSSLTESQVIAAVLTFLVLFLGYMMDSICSIISSTGNLLTKLLRCFDLYTPFSW